MDPLGTQPTQPNPQPPVVPPTPNPVPPQPAPAPVVEAQRPAPVTAPVAPVERPVEAWPPAGTPAAQEALDQQPYAMQPDMQPQVASAPLPNPLETQAIGTEATQAANPPMGVETPAQASSPQDMNGFIVTPAAQEIKNAAANSTDTIMSDQQADKLFQEEPATKARNKKHKLKKFFISLFILLLVSALAAAGYILFFGNKVAKTYTDTSSLNGYKESFTQVQSALSKQPIDSAELEAGLNKLKVASQNDKKLVVIPLGQLNPNYKKAQDLSSLESGYKSQASKYFDDYGAYAPFISNLSKSLNLISELEDTENIDLSTATSEAIDLKFGELLTECKVLIAGLGSATEPADLSKGTDQVVAYFNDICINSESSLEKAGTVLLNGKTGPVAEADKAALTNLISTYSQSSMLLTSGTTPGSDETEEFNKLLAYQRSALEDAQKLLEQVDAIIKG